MRWEKWYISKLISTQSKNKRIVSMVAVLFGLIYSFNAIVISSIRLCVCVCFVLLVVFIILPHVNVCCLHLLIFCWFSSSLGIYTTELTLRFTSDRQNGKFNVHKLISILFSFWEKKIEIPLSDFLVFLFFIIISINQSNGIKISFNLSANLYSMYSHFFATQKCYMSKSLLEFNLTVFI